jgi:hypothetical protein
MLYRTVIPVCSGILTKHLNVFSEQNVECLRLNLAKYKVKSRLQKCEVKFIVRNLHEKFLSLCRFCE